MTDSSRPPKASFEHPATVGILGGMGPAAGVDFARLFVQACERCLREAQRPVRDQAFPAHWMAQLPVVDRTAALANALTLEYQTFANKYRDQTRDLIGEVITPVVTELKEALDGA